MAKEDQSVKKKERIIQYVNTLLKKKWVVQSNVDVLGSIPIIGIVLISSVSVFEVGRVHFNELKMHKPATKNGGEEEWEERKEYNS